MVKIVKNYTIMAKLEIECDVEVNAENLEDALAKSRELRVDDFIQVKGQLLDDELRIKGLFEN